MSSLWGNLIQINITTIIVNVCIDVMEVLKFKCMLIDSYSSLNVLYPVASRYCSHLLWYTVKENDDNIVHKLQCNICFYCRFYEIIR